MLWLKAFHVVFVVAWFAGLFYLPRLFAIMTLGAVLAVLFGMSMILAAPEYLAAGWLRAKLVLVAVLLGYHIWCYRLMVALRTGNNSHSGRWYRLFNEVPALLLIAIVVLAVVK